MTLNPKQLLCASLFGLAMFAIVILSPPANAWSAAGHMLVGQIADNKITTEQPESLRDTLQTLLKKSGDYFTSLPDKNFKPEHFVSLAVAATFMDTYSDKDYSTKTYHYINYPYLPLEALEEMGFPPMSKDPVNYPNVSSKLNDSVSTLFKARDDIKQGEVSAEVALAFVQLLHFAGDSHQPLHNMVLFNSQFPDGDRGGNSFTIQPIDGNKELHAFWDAMGTAYPSIYWDDKDWQSKVDADVKDLTRYVNAHTPPPSIADIPVTSDSWGRSIRLRATAATDIYKGIKPGDALPQSYIDHAQDMSKFLVYYAGEYLAELLVYALTGDIPQNRTFKKHRFGSVYNFKRHQQNRNAVQRLMSDELKLPRLSIFTTNSEI